MACGGLGQGLGPRSCLDGTVKLELVAIRVAEAEQTVKGPDEIDDLEKYLIQSCYLLLDDWDKVADGTTNGDHVSGIFKHASLV